MAWIKRNLYFVIGTLVALGLMGHGGYYLYTQYTKEAAVTDQITDQYKELDRLNNLNPHPGSGSVDNVKAAKEQDATLHDYLAKTRAYFQRPVAIPDSPKVINAEFAAQLRNTVAELQRDATNAAVQLPNDYYFTFESQRKLMIFEPGSLEKLAVRLGDIKEICGVLFAAKVNSLDSIRREIVSPLNDQNAPDYLGLKTTSTPLADLAPYEVTFRCFSAELASVLGGLAGSPHGFIVRTINVEPAATTGDFSATARPSSPRASRIIRQPPPGLSGGGYNPGYGGGGGRYPGAYPGVRRAAPAGGSGRAGRGQTRPPS